MLNHGGNHDLPATDRFQGRPHRIISLAKRTIVKPAADSLCRNITTGPSAACDVRGSLDCRLVPYVPFEHTVVEIGGSLETKSVVARNWSRVDREQPRFKNLHPQLLATEVPQLIPATNGLPSSIGDVALGQPRWHKK